jgi:hypothetical protein
MEIRRNGSQPSAKGPEEYFTVSARIDSPFQGNAPARAAAAQSSRSSRAQGQRGIGIR